MKYERFKMTAKDARVDIKTTKAAKATLEQAAYDLATF